MTGFIILQEAGSLAKGILWWKNKYLSKYIRKILTFQDFGRANIILQFSKQKFW